MRKLKSMAGMTLAETLLAVLILLLASSIVATGMPAAVSAYRNAIDAANAQVLLSAAVNALRGELSTARDVKASGGTITYTSARTGSRATISVANDVIVVQDYSDLTGESFMQGESGSVTGKKPAPYPLLDAAMRKTTKDGTPMTVTYDTNGVSVSTDGVITIPGISVKRGTGSNAAELAKMPPSGLKIRVLTKGAGT